MTSLHETVEFRNSATYTIVLTYTVSGGARVQTARRRAERVAEQIANAASRLGSVVDVRAVAGPAGADGELLWPTPVRFSAANTGESRHDAPDKLARYLDPDYERALTSLADAHARARARRDADRERRRAIGCANALQAVTPFSRGCNCVYCRPVEHHAVALSQIDGEHWCLCGRYITTAGERCSDHRDVQLVVLDGDPEELTTLASRPDNRGSMQQDE
ncbi:hypothetical protein [Nitriliruptor alkaliphilus]|uniref:hypothetical protein n=1 Tax=Nitriliruptor alkaliphilus TaxID=427918 RepID=UPI000696CE78|nr:hypothetical protein [Nitriliruptor alkaliphilus]